MTGAALPTAGQPDNWHRRVWAIAGPIMLANVSTPLLGAVDTAVVGHLPDPVHIGGVALGSVIFSFLFWAFGFLRMGTTGFTAQAQGAGDRRETAAVFFRALALALAIGLSIALLQAPIGWLAFGLLEGTEGVLTLAGRYYDIRIWSAPASLVNYCIMGWLLGTQRAGATLLLTLVLNGLNIVLDLVLVMGFGLGVAGVAWATLMAEVATAGLGLALVARAFRADGLSLDRAALLRPDRLIALLRVNRDIFLRTLCLVAAFSYFTLRSAAMGDTLLAANTILMHFFSFASYALDGFAHAVEVLAGAALGARRRPAFRRAVKVSSLWALVASAAITLVFALAGPWLIGLFTGIAEVRAAAEGYLPWVILLPLLSAPSFQLDGIFIGATWTRTMRNAMIASLALYALAVWGLVPAFGNHGLWAALVVLMLARGLCLGAAYPGQEARVAWRED